MVRIERIFFGTRRFYNTEFEHIVWGDIVFGGCNRFMRGLVKSRTIFLD